MRERTEYTVKQISNGWLLIEDTNESMGASQTFFNTRLEAYDALAQTVADQVEASKHEDVTV